MDADQSSKIEMLYFEMYHQLITYARYCVDNDALAEEAVQETFRIACQKPEKLCNSPNPRGWIVMTLKYTIRNIRSNRSAAKRLLARYLLTQVNELSLTDDKISIDILYENVAEMEEFKLLTEMAIEGSSHEEMAARRGITVNACKKRVQRAKEILRKKLKKSL